MSAPNWLKARADCTLEDNFKAVVKTIRADVRRFNSLAPEKRDNRLFMTEDRDGALVILRAQRVRDHRGDHVVADPDYDEDFVQVIHGGGVIMARRQDRDPLVIKPKWTADNLSCDLYIEDRVFPLWNVSERILEPFLFDESA